MIDRWAAQDVQFMRDAMTLAEQAEKAGEVPVGAVLVREREIIGQGRNQAIERHDASAHAEIIAIREAGTYAQNYRLPNTTLYVTLEPCAMCVGALLHGRISRIVFGAYDRKAGALGSVIDLSGNCGLNHKLEVNGGLLESECALQLQEFFAAKRRL